MSSLSRTQIQRMANPAVIIRSTARAVEHAPNNDNFDVAEQTISPPSDVPDYNDEENKLRRSAVIEQLAATSATVILSGGYTSTHSMDNASSDDIHDSMVEQAQRLSNKAMEQPQHQQQQRETTGANQNKISKASTEFGVNYNPREDATMVQTSLDLPTLTDLPQQAPHPEALSYKDFETRCHVVRRTLPGSLVELVASQIFLGIRHSTGMSSMVKNIQQNLNNHDRLRILGDWVVCAGTNVGMSIEHATNLMMHVTFEGMHFIVYCLNARLPFQRGFKKAKQQLSSTWRSSKTRFSAAGDQALTTSFDAQSATGDDATERDQIQPVANNNYNSISGSRSSSIISSRGSKISNDSNSSSGNDVVLSAQKSIIEEKNRYVADMTTPSSALNSQLKVTTEEGESNSSSTSLAAASSSQQQHNVRLLDRKSSQALVRDSWKQHFQQNANMQMTQAFRV